LLGHTVIWSSCRSSSIEYNFFKNTFSF